VNFQNEQLVQTKGWWGLDIISHRAGHNVLDNRRFVTGKEQQKVIRKTRLVRNNRNSGSGMGQKHKVDLEGDFTY
tara:strand:- start:1779 stop:2003 length:225 start_codon:yes stop_codon:yes gene_type:complete